MSQMETRKCAGCEGALEVDAFSKKQWKAAWDGQGLCISCVTAKTEKSYDEYYSDRACRMCGEKKPEDEFGISKIISMVEAIHAISAYIICFL